MNFKIQPGIIYQLPLPFSDEIECALAISPPDQEGDVRCVLITTTHAPYGEQSLELHPTDFSEDSLPLPGYLKLGKTFYRHQTKLIKPLARLTDQAMILVYRRMISLDVVLFADIYSRNQSFEPGVTKVPPSGKVIGASELQNMVEASLDGWLTSGRFNAEFERKLAEFLGIKHALTANSGSSANLLALAALTSPKLGEKALKPGDEVISVAAGFPTTVNPVLQYGLVPVFVDIHIPTYNIDPEQIEAAVSDKTRAIMIAHTLGNPFDLDEVMRVARKYDLWVVEDCCDALGSTYCPQREIGYGRRDTISAGKPRLVGTFGDIATLSFYPAHHITMGEGGAVMTRSGQFKSILESLRDWGRDCYCEPGKDNTCGKRFDWKLGSLPVGYDHKYTYSHLGYNFKISDLQAACGLAQMDRLPGFIATRKHNFSYLKERLKSCEEFLILPEATPNSDPAWFGFPITIREGAGISRVELLRDLNQHRIGTRPLFAGNLTRQPYMQDRYFRQVQELTNTDLVMNNTFWLGVYPGLTESMLDYVASRLSSFFGLAE
jgi:CDP-6-deoxy-D-xylo-4-hexulose-3-dehydrase